MKSISNLLKNLSASEFRDLTIEMTRLSQLYSDYYSSQVEAGLKPSNFNTWWEHEKELKENIIDSD